MRIERVQKTLKVADNLVRQTFEGERNDPEPGLVVAMAIFIAMSDVVDAIDRLQP